ncbi:putative small secreted protein [Cupriavidus necator]|nr:putative small secreted protein [Cupriavidus necator]
MPRTAAVKSAAIPNSMNLSIQEPSKKEPGVKKGWIWCVLFATLLAGCNTMAGLGQDIQRGGQKLESSADRHK